MFFRWAYSCITSRLIIHSDYFLIINQHQTLTSPNLQSKSKQRLTSNRSFLIACSSNAIISSRFQEVPKVHIGRLLRADKILRLALNGDRRKIPEVIKNFSHSINQHNRAA